MEPKTQRQIAKENTPVVEDTVVLYNCSKQMLAIHLKQPAGVNFFLGAQTIYLHPNKQATFIKNRLMWEEQISNLQKKGMLKVLAQ